MVYGVNLFSKNKLDNNKLINQLNLDPKKTLFINVNDDWAGFNDNINTIIECNGLLKEDDHDRYTGYIYYDVSTDIKGIKDDFIKIKDANVVVEE